MSRPLTHTDKVAAFKAATAGLEKRFGSPLEATDEQLHAALRHELGIYGGRSGPGEMHLTWQGAGLRIWASWESHNPYQLAPLFRGAATIAMARVVYGIADPTNPQLSLF